MNSRVTIDSVAAPTRTIIVPTYKDHFPFAVRFLKNYCRRVRDRTPIPVHFITSDRDETAEFSHLIAQGGPGVRAHVSVTSIRDLLDQFGYPKEAAAAFSVNTFTNKASYQSIKKIMGVIQLGYDQTLVLDCECFVYRPVSFHQIFDEYFAGPMVFHSEIRCSISDQVNRASLSVIGASEATAPEIYRRWIFDYYGWFFEKDAVRQFQEHVENVHRKSLVDVLVETPDVFEIISYRWFLYLNRERFPRYRFLPAEDLIREYLGNAAEAYLGQYEDRGHGIVEGLFRGLSPEAFAGLGSFVNRYRLRFFRFDRSSDDQYHLVLRFLRTHPELAVMVSTTLGPELFSWNYWTRQSAKRILRRMGLRS